MMKSKKKNSKGAFDQFALYITRITGSTGAFITAVAIVVVWIVTGPLFDYSDTWQLVINTGTTIVTFLMVFLIQKTQNKDSMAMQLKLNELIASNKEASNTMINIEDLTEEDLIVLHKYFTKLAKMAKEEKNVHVSHSVREAEESHDSKYNSKRK